MPTTTPAGRLADLLDSIDQRGAFEVAAEHGQPNHDLAHAYLLGLVSSFARQTLGETTDAR